MTNEGARGIEQAGGRQATRRAALPTALILAPTLLLLLPVSLLILRSGFDGLYGQDAFAYFDYATGPVRQALLAGERLPPFFWPPGYPLLVALSSFIVGRIPAAGQIVSLTAGALVPLFTVLIARELQRERRHLAGSQAKRVQHPAGRDAGAPWGIPWVALLAGLLVAATGQLWQSSAVVMADTPALLAATVGVWALLRYGAGRHAGWLWLAAGAVAFAVLTRWAYALLAIPCTVYALYCLWRRPPREALPQGLLAAVPVLLILSPVILSAWERAQTGSGAGFLGNFAVYGWHPLNALRREFVTMDGVLRYTWPNGLYYALAPAHRYYFTPLLAPLLLPGLWALARQRRRPAALLLLAWAALIFGFHAGAAYQNFRFTLAHLPPLAIIAALGAALLARTLPGALRPLLPLVLGAGLLWMTYGGYTLTDGFMQRKQADLATVAWVEQQAAPEAQLFTFNITFTFQRYSRLETHELYFLTPEEMADLLQQGRPTYVLLDVGNVQAQWVGRAPATNFAWLQQAAGLTRLGQQRQYTLFRVGPDNGAPAEDAAP